MKARILAASAAALGSVLLVTTPASAHTTDDWFAAGSAPSGWNYRVAESTAGSVHQKTQIWWTGYEGVAVRGAVSDQKNDGYCGAVQIRYENLNSDGNWAGHWHYRTLVNDCSTNSDAEVSSYYYHLGQGARSLSARACHTDSSARIIECEQNWH
ncbi:hypothetical protein AB0I16_19600 [Streptomyces sp. NPDC050703]|uniref:hypothetical protein n=1 Tax=Streptomyces sp. NPDC050703 TaxID=3157218 RepID=UPI00342A5566